MVLAKHNYQGILTTVQSLINLPSLDILWKHSNQYGGKVRVGPATFSPFATPFLTSPRTLTCSFSEYKIYPGHGGMYIRKDGQVKWIPFWSSPARALPQSQVLLSGFPEEEACSHSMDNCLETQQQEDWGREAINCEMNRLLRRASAEARSPSRCRRLFAAWTCKTFRRRRIRSRRLLRSRVRLSLRNEFAKWLRCSEIKNRRSKKASHK